MHTESTERSFQGSPTRATSHLPWVGVVGLALAISGVGCRDSSRAPSDKSDLTPAQETWDAVFIGNTKIGWIHTAHMPPELSEETLVKITSRSTLKMPRYGQSIALETEVESVETPEGAVRSFTLHTLAGPSPITVAGRYRQGRLKLVTRSPGQQTESEMAWSDENGGFFAVEQSVRRAPLTTGERRELTCLIPGYTGVQLASVILEAVELEETHLLGDRQRLLKVRQTIHVADQQIDGWCWTDQDGEMLKTSVLLGGLQQTTYRTDKERALTETPTADFDLGWDSIVPVSTPLPRPHQTRRILYRATLPTRDPSQVFPSGGSQQVESIDGHSARIAVLSVRPDVSANVPEESPPTDADRHANNLIQSDEPHVRDVARQVAAADTDPWTICQAMEQWVFQNVRNRNFGQGLATAADVVRSRDGDCTEHAVLLAALCRARGVPARAAIGLVYSAADRGFAFHMWNEVWIANRWIPLDATLGLGGIGAAHLKTAHSDLSAERAEAAMLSILQVLHQLQLEILELDEG